MPDINQNRTVEEIHEVLKQFLYSTHLQHEIDVGYEALAVSAQQVLNAKVNNLLDERMESFSIPELMKILALCISKTQPEPEPDHHVTQNSKHVSKQIKSKKAKLQ